MTRTAQLATAVVVVFLVGSCERRERVASGREDVGGRGEQSEAAQILRAAHFVTALPQLNVTGQLRKEGRRFPVGLYRREGQLQFAYRDPEEGGAVRIHSQLAGDRYEIFEVVGGKRWECSPGRLQESVGGTDFNHEDLMMPWLLWPGAEMVGEETLKGMKTWKVRVRNPDPAGLNREIVIWVHQKSGGLIQAISHDAEGRMVKRFCVTEVARIAQGVYSFRGGRLDRIDPESSEVVGWSYLELDSPALVGALEQQGESVRSARP